MKKLALAAVVGALAVAPVAQADIVDYVEVSVGYTQLPDLEQKNPSNTFSFDAGYNVGGAFGWHMTPRWALELDLFYTSSEYDLFKNFHIESFSAMANAIYTFDVSWSCTPYLGVGIGINEVTLDRPVDSDSDIVFGYQLMGGVKTNLTDNMDLFVEYRYQGGEDAAVFAVEHEYTSHNGSIGIRINL